MNVAAPRPSCVLYHAEVGELWSPESNNNMCSNEASPRIASIYCHEDKLELVSLNAKPGVYYIARRRLTCTYTPLSMTIDTSMEKDLEVMCDLHDDFLQRNVSPNSHFGSDSRILTQIHYL